jgi:hypothetical protein
MRCDSEAAAAGFLIIVMLGVTLEKSNGSAWLRT